jgi:hypothetical protein
MLQSDLKARVNWGSGQQPVINEFDMSGGGERKLQDNTDLSLAFAEKMDDKKLFLFVDVEDKPAEFFLTHLLQRQQLVMWVMIMPHNLRNQAILLLFLMKLIGTVWR